MKETNIPKNIKIVEAQYISLGQKVVNLGKLYELYNMYFIHYIFEEYTDSEL